MGVKNLSFATVEGEDRKETTTFTPDRAAHPRGVTFQTETALGKRRNTCYQSQHLWKMSDPYTCLS